MVQGVGFALLARYSLIGASSCTLIPVRTSASPYGSHPPARSITFHSRLQRKIKSNGAGCRIRTYEGISQQIYSLSCLTASLTLLVVPYAVTLFFGKCRKSFGLQLRSSSQNFKQLTSLLGLKFCNSHVMYWSHLRDSNPRPAVYKTAALAN
jgi:hypothetical protein